MWYRNPDNWRTWYLHGPEGYTDYPTAAVTETA
jgi:hypothetical protein